MARNKAPISTTTSHNISAEDRQRRLEEEEKLKSATNDNLIEEPPCYLNDLAQQYYHYIIREMSMLNLLCNLDRFVVAHAAIALADIQELTTILNNEGYIIDSFDKNGNPKKEKHPAYQMRDVAKKEFKSNAMMLGLSPTARANLAGLQLQKKEDDSDPLMQALSRKKNN